MNCTVCGSRGDIHHIVHRCEGGLNFNLNYKYLCRSHHRGLNGPHRNKIIDYTYKLEMQDMLSSIFNKEFYSIAQINNILGLSISSRKKFKDNLFLYKEGFKKSEIIYFLMGQKTYTLEGLEDLTIQLAINNEKSL